ncbi:mannose-6-phosphate isomerase [Rudanella paleaurantiibacter]|uniref:Mannose-6-phosphate isomerase n=1 Tax=Rudanella paleaurantiibacter TaxID=2614655 RepID=A0A7J5U5Q8_9BACT|nr:type I phosphomannose isomerase catalytic subunit [Rudanella paleaurantiibacter]KAB7732480.1 mannose-6-phosphate isomerase [Rudanella paleaurantiibacter]
MLYPLTFETIFKDKIWGGQKIKTILGKDFTAESAGALPNCGETWEVSGVEGNVSVVSDGPLAGKNLAELIGEYKADLVGQHVYEQFGDTFPLLVKFIDANDDLSIQVHPNDQLAKERHNSFGKTEMWYILQADEGATLNSGFNRTVSRDEYLKAVEENTLMDILNIEPAKPGDVFFLPAGRVHYIGKGLLLAEIQQTSDITYRIYDFDRTDDKGQKRELHTEQAVDAIDYQFHDTYKTEYEKALNHSVNAVTCPYFVTNVLHFDREVLHDFSHLDSFVILVCVGGGVTIQSGNTHEVTLKMGQCALIPASVKSVTLIPDGEMTLLESYVPGV